MKFLMSVVLFVLVLVAVLVMTGCADIVPTSPSKNPQVGLCQGVECTQGSVVAILD